VGEPDYLRPIKTKDVVRASPDSRNEVQNRRMVRPSRLVFGSIRMSNFACLCLEKVAPANDDAYREALNLYRSVRGRPEMDIRFGLGTEPTACLEIWISPVTGSTKLRVSDHNRRKPCWQLSPAPTKLRQAILWCPEEDLNPQTHLRAANFKSAADGDSPLNNNGLFSSNVQTGVR